MIIREQYNYSRNKTAYPKPISIDRYYRISTTTQKGKQIDKIYCYVASNTSLKGSAQLELFNLDKIEEFNGLIEHLPVEKIADDTSIYIDPYGQMEVYSKRVDNDLYVIAYNLNEILIFIFKNQIRRYKGIIGAFSRKRLTEKLPILYSRASLIHES